MLHIQAVPAFSQELPEYAEMGTIDITFGDERITHHTMLNTVPNDLDRQVRSASRLIMKPQLMGGVNISPDDVFVLITSRDSLSLKPGQSSRRVEISLAPEALELKSKPAASIRFCSFYLLCVFNIGKCRFVVSLSDDGRAIECGIGLSITASVQTEPVYFAARCWDRPNTAKLCK